MTQQPSSLSGTPDALVAEYVAQTRVCSVWSCMRKAPAYPPLRDAGYEAVPAILRALERRKGGVALIHVLHEVTGEAPDAAAVEVEDGWAKWTVDDAANAWLSWGREKGYL